MASVSSPSSKSVNPLVRTNDATLPEVSASVATVVDGLLPSPKKSLFEDPFTETSDAKDDGGDGALGNSRSGNVFCCMPTETAKAPRPAAAWDDDESDEDDSDGGCGESFA